MDNNELSTNLAEVGTDCISRRQAIDATWEEPSYTDPLNVLTEVRDRIKALPPAQPESLANESRPLVKDTISRRAAIDALDKCHCGGKDENGRPWIYKENAVEAIEMVEPSPSAEPKRGRWISADAMFHGVPFYCSECGENTMDTVMGKPRWKFCPMCGAKMEVNHDR